MECYLLRLVTVSLHLYCTSKHLFWIVFTGIGAKSLEESFIFRKNINIFGGLIFQAIEVPDDVFLIIFWSFGTNGKNSSLCHCLIRLPWKRQKRSEREKKRECVWIAKLAKMFFCYNSNQSELKCLLYIHDRGPAQVWKSYRIRRIVEQLWNMSIILTRSINSP